MRQNPKILPRGEKKKKKIHCSGDSYNWKTNNSFLGKKKGSKFDILIFSFVLNSNFSATT